MMNPFKCARYQVRVSVIVAMLGLVPACKVNELSDGQLEPSSIESALTRAHKATDEGLALFEHGDRLAGVRRMEQALDLHTNEYTYIALARSNRLLGKSREALSYYERALECLIPLRSLEEETWSKTNTRMSNVKVFGPLCAQIEKEYRLLLNETKKMQNVSAVESSQLTNGSVRTRE